uniref:Uncharacterized protein n=1 Tax=Chromera velia CCMP2878 TaxID=1169474 RepID=A0A0G4F5V7_9ALVE|eukprot:Cvel_2783.t1-p1 / transcript=Cvel_2783.t1 / gene=Cvel_2783 / organism=Chromera_velia_CCMP2878 / gene_product=hypothetical protein / transcript_product=hypothetical protein / location=Cvel_scaffold112:60616-66131(+) / protein_length=775 / sequence_SO=supercontig / SO=protein_coding / is_pseudo=false
MLEDKVFPVAKAAVCGALSKVEPVITVYGVGITQDNLMMAMSTHYSNTETLIDWLADLQDHYASEILDRVSSECAGLLQIVRDCGGKPEGEKGAELVEKEGKTHGEREAKEKERVLSCVLKSRRGKADFLDLQREREGEGAISISPSSSPPSPLRVHTDSIVASLTDVRTLLRSILSPPGGSNRVPPMSIDTPTASLLIRRVEEAAAALQKTVEGHVGDSAQAVESLLQHSPLSLSLPIHKFSGAPSPSLSEMTPEARGEVVENATSLLMRALAEIPEQVTKQVSAKTAALSALLDSVHEKTQRPRRERRSSNSPQPSAGVSSSSDEFSQLLSDGLKDETIQILDRLEESHSTHLRWVDEFEAFLPHMEIFTGADAPPSSNGGKKGGWRHHENFLGVRDSPEELSLLLLKMYSVVEDFRTDVGAYLSSARALVREERDAADKIRDYIQCHKKNENEHMWGGRESSHRRDEGEFTGDIGKVIPLWQRLQRHRRQSVALCVRAFRSGVHAFQSAAGILSIGFVLPKLTFLEMDRLQRKLKAAAAHRKKKQKQGQRDYHRESVTDRILLEIGESLGVNETTHSEVVGEGKSGKGGKGVCRERWTSADAERLARSSLARHIAEGPPGSLVDVLHGAAALLYWLHSRLRQEDAWGDPALVQLSLSREGGGVTEGGRGRMGVDASEWTGEDFSSAPSSSESNDVDVEVPDEEFLRTAETSVERVLGETGDWLASLQIGQREERGGEEQTEMGEEEEMGDGDVAEVFDETVRSVMTAGVSSC